MTKAKKNIGDASTCKNKCQLRSAASHNQKAFTAECAENAEGFRASALNTIKVQTRTPRMNANSAIYANHPLAGKVRVSTAENFFSRKQDLRYSNTENAEEFRDSVRFPFSGFFFC